MTPASGTPSAPESPVPSPADGTDSDASRAAAPEPDPALEPGPVPAPAPGQDTAPAAGIIWTGAYTPDGGGRAEGIGSLLTNADGSLAWLGTAVEAQSPSFVAVHPSQPVVYAVAEQRKMVQAYRRVGPYALEPFGEPQPAGDATCHVAVDPGGRYITAACWGDGQVLLYGLDSDGGITGRFPAPPSVDPHESLSSGEYRQSRAHASLTLQDGRIMTTDLGHDTLRIWAYGPGTGLVPDHEVVLPFGSGPRHLVQHVSGNVFVVSEYSVEVFVVRPGAGRSELIFRGPATVEGALEGDSAAEICLGPGGNFAYAGVRGSNRISVLEVTGHGTKLRPVHDADSGGNWPRHHLVRGSWLHVAHERSDNVATFALDPVTGLPGPKIHDVGTPSPTALVPGS